MRLAFSSSMCLDVAVVEISIVRAICEMDLAGFLERCCNMRRLDLLPSAVKS